VEKDMRILIDDAATATSKGARGRAATAVKRGRSTAGQIAVSCGPRKTGADRECACAGVDLDDQPEHAAAALDALGVALMNRGCLDEGAKLVEQALRIRRKLFGDDHPTTALSLNSYARVLRERGELADAEKTSQTAVRINRGAYDGHGLPVAVSLYELGVIHLNQGRYEEAEAAAIEGLGILQKLGLDDTDPHTTRLMDIRGRAEAARGALDAASATFEALLKIDRAQVGADHPKYATHLANFASVKESQKLYRQAEAGYLKAIDVYANKLKRRCHPNLIDMYANLGSLYLARNAKPTDLREAARYLNEALRLSLKLRGSGHLLVANDYANLGRLHYNTEDRRGALTNFMAALRIYEKSVRGGSIPGDFIFIAEVLTWIGRALVEGGTAGEAAKAEPLLERAAPIWNSHCEAGRIGEAIAEACLGRALHLQNKDPARSRALLTKGYDVLSQELGTDDELVQQIRAWLDELDARTEAA
jgi:tetratricopeptide (TPR) repeat protein